MVEGKSKLLEYTDKGLYCRQADVYIDPSRKVKNAIITHGHADHARAGHRHYLCHKLTEPVLKLRLSKNINIQTLQYNEIITINGVKISLHPAGHIIGSAQVRLEYADKTWVVTGDYKLENDGVSGEFEPVRCDYFITECTFGLPIYQWLPQSMVFDEINSWWSQNQSLGITSVIFGYSLGKSQRLIQGLDESIGPIFTHNTIENVNVAFRSAGVNLKPTQRITSVSKKSELKGGILITPPSGIDSRTLKSIEPYQVAMASGWMATRNTRRNRMVNNGFVLSDHADWIGINKAVNETGASHVITTHGYTHEMVRWFEEEGLKALADSTDF